MNRKSNSKKGHNASIPGAGRINYSGVKIKVSDLLTYAFLAVIVISGVWKYFYEQEKLRSSSLTIGKVVVSGYTPGLRVGQPEVTCEFSIDDTPQRKTYERKDLDLKIGDCLEIIFSIDDITVSTINYDKGSIPCK